MKGEINKPEELWTWNPENSHMTSPQREPKLLGMSQASSIRGAGGNDHLHETKSFALGGNISKICHLTVMVSISILRLF